MEHLPLLRHQRVRCRPHFELEVRVPNCGLEDSLVHKRREVDRSGTFSSVGNCDELILLLRSIKLVEQIRAVIGVLSLHIFVVDAFLIFVEILAVASVGVNELVPLLLRKVGCYHACCGVTPTTHDGIFVKHDLLHGVVVIWIKNTA